MTARKNNRLPTPKPNQKVNLKNFCKVVSSTEFWAHIKYIFERLFYIFQTLLIGLVIQYIWNFFMLKCMNGEHQINLFESSVLWIWLY
jgi:hypothetical protein